MSIPLDSDPDEKVADVEDEVVELAPSVDVDVAVDAPAESFHVELVAGSGPSLTTETTSLLHERLRAVAILLLVVYGGVLAWAITNRDTDLPGTVRILTAVRLVILGAILAILSARQSFTQAFLRGVEYTLFGALTLLWIGLRYRVVIHDAQAANLIELLVGGREAMIGLFMLMIVHGLFIPNRWQDTAKVVLLMAMAPTVVLVLFQTRQPQLAEQVQDLFTWRNVSMNVLILVVGTFLATYGSHVLHALRGTCMRPENTGNTSLSRRLAAAAWATSSWQSMC